MFDFFKRKDEAGPAPEYKDSLLGSLVCRQNGVWSGEIPFGGLHAGLLLPGSKFQPSPVRLALAKSVVPRLAEKVDGALQFAANANPKLIPVRLSFAALNLLNEDVSDGFILDFVEVGDRSGGRWQVHFERGVPVRLEYK